MRVICSIRREQPYYFEGKYTRDGIPKAWDDHFAMPWKRVRTVLNAIAGTTRLAAKFDAIAMWWDQFLLNSVPNGTIIVPIDEDDWVHPNLPAILRAAPSDNAVVRWRTYLGLPDGNWKIDCNDHLLRSCAYAMRTPVTDWSSAKWHTAANDWVKTQKVHDLSGPLSFYVATPASLSVLRTNDLGSIRAMVHKFATGAKPPPPEFEAPYQRLVQLMVDLWESRKQK